MGCQHLFQKFVAMLMSCTRYLTKIEAQYFTVLRFNNVNPSAALSMPSSTERLISNVLTIEKYRIFILKNLETLLHRLNFEMNVQH